MRDLSHHAIDRYRDRSEFVLEQYGSVGDQGNGLFRVPCSTVRLINLCVLASNGDGWDHVSVSLPHRCPDVLRYRNVELHRLLVELPPALPSPMAPSAHVDCNAAVIDGGSERGIK